MMTVWLVLAWTSSWIVISHQHLLSSSMVARRWSLTINKDVEIHPHTVINKVRGDNAELIMVKTVWRDCIILSDDSYIFCRLYVRSLMLGKKPPATDVIVVRVTHRTKNHENKLSKKKKLSIESYHCQGGGASKLQPQLSGIALKATKIELWFGDNFSPILQPQYF